jgi:hypothetical protein
MNIKVCSKCKEHKTNTEFSKNKKAKDGFYCQCKSCVKICNQAYWEKNKNILKPKNNAYRQAHLDESRAYLKTYRETHKEEAKQYRRDNADYYKAYNEAYKSRKNEWISQRRKNDINFAISYNLRARFHSFVSAKGKHTFDVLGLPCDTFLSWIEFQFADGMSWNNYGVVWHLDHILPVSKFNLENETEQNVCFGWANFQPLLKSDNWDKSNQIYIHDFFNCFISAHRFIANEHLGDLEYQTLAERLRWLRATISGMVKSSWMKEPDVSPTSAT